MYCFVALSKSEVPDGCFASFKVILWIAVRDCRFALILKGKAHLVGILKTLQNLEGGEALENLALVLEAEESCEA